MAGLLTVERRDGELLERLVVTGEQLSAAREPDAIGRIVLDAVTNSLGAPVAVISLVDGDALRAAWSRGLSDD
jgi:hypothetical protein